MIQSGIFLAIKYILKLIILNKKRPNGDNTSEYNIHDGNFSWGNIDVIGGEKYIFRFTETISPVGIYDISYILYMKLCPGRYEKYDKEG